MAKDKEISEGDLKDKSPEPKKAKKVRIGILMRPFMQCTSYGPHVLNKHVKAWSRGQIVWNEQDVEKLLELGAPLEVYCRDVD